jgi:hypothetical protein
MDWVAKLYLVMVAPGLSSMMAVKIVNTGSIVALPGLATPEANEASLVALFLRNLSPEFVFSFLFVADWSQSAIPPMPFLGFQGRALLQC